MIEKLLKWLGYIPEIDYIELDKQYDALYESMNDKIDEMLEQNIELGKENQSLKIKLKKLEKQIRKGK